MKLFVTGGTGFVGSHFINQAHAAGHKVIALRRSEASRSRISLTQQPTWVNAEFSAIMPQDLEGIDCLIHFAAAGVSPQPADWDGCYRTNVLETLNLCRCAIEAGVSLIISAGTYAEYGRSGLRYDKIPTDAPLEPTGAYAASKASAFIALQALAREQRVSILWSRLFSVFGEGQFEDNFWPSLKRAALSGEDFPMTQGEQIRDYISVEKVAGYFVDALGRQDLEPGKCVVENVASGQPITLREFSLHWWRTWNASGEIRFGSLPYRSDEVMRYVPMLSASSAISQSPTAS
jgi:UDP-glucose 4-epimerase